MTDSAAQTRPRFFRFISHLFALCFATGIAASQTLPNITAADQLGELPYESYHGGDVDVVSLTNGTLSLHVPVLSYPQRGNLHVSYSLRYNNINQHYGPQCLAPDPCELDWALNVPAPVGEKSDVFATFDQSLGIWPSTAYPQSHTIGTITYTDYYGDYYVVTPDGGKHILGNLGTMSLVNYPTGGSNSYWVSSGPYETLDATGIKVTGTLAPLYSLWGSSTTIVTPDGLTQTTSSTQQTIQDTNGNFLNLNGSGGLLDSIGRSIPYPPNHASASNTSTSACPTGPLAVAKAVSWSVPAANGSIGTYTFCYVTVTPNMPSSMVISGAGTVYGQVPSSTNLQSVVLPNGLSWKFEYNDPDSTQTYNGQPVTYGTLSKITLPTGGSISYTWINAGHSIASNNPTSCNNGGRWISSRTVTDLDGVPHTWNYAYRVTIGSSGGTVVTDPLGNDTAHIMGLSGGCTAYETQTIYYQGSYTGNNILRTINTAYSSTSTGNTFPNPNLNVVPTTVTTVEANGQTTKTFKNYDSGFSYTDHFGNTGLSGIYGKVITEQAYDYGSGAPGSLLRTTNTSYVWQNPNPNYATYLSNNLLNLPYSVQVKDGGGTQRAYTYFGYDESALQSSSVTEQKNTGGSRPGNLTSMHRWLNASTTATTLCAAVTSGYLVSSKVYYDTGEVQKSTDACGYFSTFQYSSTYYGAFLTTATNPLSQVTTYGYDFNSGLVTSIQDPNVQSWTKTYDIMGRETSVNFPDGGSSTYCYTDMGGATCTQSGTAPYAKVTTKAITSSPVLNEVSTVVLDGLGRVSQTQLNSDAPGTTYTLTTYDALGRKLQVYNPTRCSTITSNCASETTWGVTTYNYDVLSRTTSVVEQDGSTVGTNYASFPCTTVTDETGKSRQSCVDGLGRMTGVWEDPSNLNYETNYTYDALGNLTNVNQKGSNVANARARTFVYDSLSQLTSATNPESGNIAYAYDADGNLITKTAPLPNQTGSSTVTNTSTYDKLNRLTSKSYMDGGCLGSA
jgi:YD repeat-containing protein